MVRGRGKKQLVQGTPAVVHLDNKYTILDTVGARDQPEVSHGDRVSGAESVPVDQKGNRESRTALVIVRGTDRRFCGNNRD